MERQYIKTLILIISLFNISVNLSAQNVDMMLFNRDVNGIEVGTILTKDILIAKFGDPTRYIEQDSGDNGINKWYYFGDNYFHVKDDVFDEFSIVDSSFVAFTNHVKGGLKIGDPISLLDNFKYGAPKKETDTCYILFHTADNPVYIYVENDIIVAINYHDPM